MICSRTRPMMRLKKIETPQIAVAIPMVRAWLLVRPGCAWAFAPRLRRRRNPIPSRPRPTRVSPFPSTGGRCTTDSSARARSAVPHSSAAGGISASTPCGAFTGTIWRRYDLDQLAPLPPAHGGDSPYQASGQAGQQEDIPPAQCRRSYPTGVAWRATAVAGRTASARLHSTRPPDARGVPAAPRGSPRPGNVSRA